MWNTILRKPLILIVLVSFLPLALHAEDKRTIPLDMYLIIDGSASLEDSKNDAIAWIGQMTDRTLMDGDTITIWLAGDEAQVIYSGTLSSAAGKEEIKNKLRALDTGGKTADFSGALRDLTSKLSQTAENRSRMSYAMLIISSAKGLEPTLTGSAQGLLRWSRSEKYERWQVLILAPDIGRKVQQAAAAYMNSR